MRALRRWIPTGLAVVVVGIAAIGYGLMATDIAAPIGGDLGRVAVPDERGATAVLLSDGRPAFVVRTGDAVHVIDARPPLEAGTPSALVTWCPGSAYFHDWVNPGTYAADGGLLGGGPAGLIAYPVAPSADGSEVTVGSDGTPRGQSDPAESYECDGNEAVMHEPDRNDAFDPSVAVDEEPPGWIWIEGRLEAIGGQALLCDDVDGIGCATGAVVRGIDPAKLAALPEHLSGWFLGRVGDGAIDELHHIPLSVRGS